MGSILGRDFRKPPTGCKTVLVRVQFRLQDCRGRLATAGTALLRRLCNSGVTRTLSANTQIPAVSPTTCSKEAFSLHAQNPSVQVVLLQAAYCQSRKSPRNQDRTRLLLDDSTGKFHTTRRRQLQRPESNGCQASWQQSCHRKVFNEPAITMANHTSWAPSLWLANRV